MCFTHCPGKVWQGVVEIDLIEREDRVKEGLLFDSEIVLVRDQNRNRAAVCDLQPPRRPSHQLRHVVLDLPVDLAGERQLEISKRRPRRDIEQLLAGVVAVRNIVEIVDLAQQRLSWIAQVQNHLQFEVLQDLQVLGRRRQMIL
jgi:hypothetical protein